MYTTQTCSIFLSIRLDLCHIANTWEIDDTIRFVSYQNIVRGIAKKKPNTLRKYFFSACTCIFTIGGNTINVKLSSNGSVQLTGCRKNTDVLDIFAIIWHKLGYVDLTASIIVSMTNYTIKYPTGLNKIKLDACLSKAPFDIIFINEPFYCRPGLFFKIPIGSRDYLDQKCMFAVCKSGAVTWETQTFEQYLATLPEKKREKKLEQHFVAFTIFDSGSCNVSGIGPDLTERIINQVLNFVAQNY